MDGTVDKTPPAWVCTIRVGKITIDQSGCILALMPAGVMDRKTAWQALIHGTGHAYYTLTRGRRVCLSERCNLSVHMKGGACFHHLYIVYK